jgi:heme/copper-type cytochrome/quinol oxidase subunit 3
MYWFLAGEFAVFGGLIFIYILFRWRNPEWSEHAAHLIDMAGAFNTLLLVSTSVAMARAHAAVQQGQLQLAVRNMGLTLIGAAVFLSVKAYEYSHEIAQGFAPGTNLFWSFYYTMTGLHAAHILGGMVAIAVILLGVRRGRNAHRVEYVGLYWHFVDCVWLCLFPLLYLIS